MSVTQQYLHLCTITCPLYPPSAHIERQTLSHQLVLAASNLTSVVTSLLHSWQNILQGATPIQCFSSVSNVEPRSKELRRSSWKLEYSELRSESSDSKFSQDSRGADCESSVGGHIFEASELIILNGCDSADRGQFSTVSLNVRICVLWLVWILRSSVFSGIERLSRFERAESFIING